MSFTLPAALRRFERIRPWLAFGLLVGGSAWGLSFVDHFYPVRRWLFWRYAGYWSLTALFVLACASSGHLLLSRLRRSRLPLAEHCVQALALGVLVFTLGWFAIGIAGAFSPWTAIGWPVLLAVSGAVPLVRFGWRARRKLKASRRRAPRPGWLYFATLVFSVVAIALVYLPIVSPKNLAFDAQFYHMALAEHYAADGRIGMSPEGWFMASYPQLATYVYSWAFALPLRLTFDKAELASHLEFALFLYTVASVPVLVRRLAPRRWLPLSGAALFLFPETFCYDSLLSGAADHIAAIWCVPIFLSTLRVLATLSVADGALLALSMSGALLSKYSVWAMVLVPGGAVCVRAAIAGLRSVRGRGTPDRRWLTTPLVIGGVVAIATAPHWLKNLVWYHDPLYPLLHAYFPSRPWTPDNLARFHTYIPKQWVAEHNWSGVKATLWSALDFSLIPRDWWPFHRDVPIFGSLFTLSLPCLFLIRRRSRLLLLYAAAHVAVMQWYWSFHQDRYLQSYVPWMAAGIVAVGAQLWDLGLGARLGMAVALFTQLVWGADVPFFPTHAMNGGSPHKVSMDLISSGFRGDFVQRFRPLGVWHDLDDAIPKGSRVLLHDEHVHLGIGSPTICDFAAWQGGISYGRDPAPARVYALLHGMGATHLLWPTSVSRAHDSIAADIAFFNFVTRFAQGAKPYESFTLANMPPSSPEGTFHNRAIVLGCDDTYKSGLYNVTDLNVQPYPWPGPTTGFPLPREPFAPASAWEPQASSVDAIVQDVSCFSDGTRIGAVGFVEAASRGNYRIWVKRP